MSETTSEPAAWKPDPFGRHELRYWDGTAWTAHVSDAGTQGSDEPVPSDPAVPPPPPPPPTSAAPAPETPAPAASSGGSWKDKLKQAAQQGKELADKGKAEMAKQQAKRQEAAANDPDTLWIGERKSLAGTATGMSSATYRITKDRIYFQAGMLGTTSEQVPLWAVRDMDVRQSLTQRGKNIGDVVVWLEHPEFTGRSEVTLDNIEDPHGVRDLLNRQVSEARSRKLMQTQTQYIQHSGSMFGAPAAPMAPAAPAAPAAPTATPPVDLADQLRKLAELRDQGILTEEEFAAQKARLLGG